MRIPWSTGWSRLLFVAIALAPIQAPANQTAPPPAAADIGRVDPLVPPGISDYNLEIFGKLFNTWTTSGDEQVIEVRGDFSARMGLYRLSSNDAVIWFRQLSWQDRPYVEAEIYLWQNTEIVYPAQTVETGSAQLITLRTFGKLLTHMDGHAPAPNEESPLYREASRARRLLEVAPPREPELEEDPIVVAPDFDALALRRPKVRKMVSYTAKQTSHQQHGNQTVVISIEDVYVSHGSPEDSAEFVELRADAAVLYLHGEAVSEAVPGVVDRDRPETPRRSSPRSDVEDVEPTTSPADEPELGADETTEEQAFQQYVSAVYLEGDVVLTQGLRMIRAERLFYDVENERALILDAVTRVMEPTRDLPIYVRADRIRRLSVNRYAATNALLTTSEFHTPHVSLRAAELELTDITPRDERGRVVGVQAGSYEATGTTLNLEGTPVLYWPYSAGTFSRDSQAFKSAKMGYNSDFGGILETQWYLFNLLGIQAPEGFDATGRLDYYTDRGPGAGVDMDYRQDDFFGLFRGYYIHDEGEDDLGPRGGPPDTDNRGRLLLRHRQFLPQGWELSLEGAYVSDDNYLESYERNEWENGKDQENLLRILKRMDNWQFSATANWRIPEFLTQTERLPDTRFTLIGEPLTEHATWYSDNRAGVVRYRYDERRYFNGESDRRDNTGATGSVIRGDTRQEVQFPLPDIGPVKITPYLMARGSAWDDSPSYFGGGGRQRGMVGYGVNANIIASRVYDDVYSELFDLNRLRHVIKADVSAFNAHTNIPPEQLTPFDSGVEDIDDFGGVVLGLRQRWQTRRGKPGEERTVDWMTLDVEAGFFHDRQDGEFTHGDHIMARPEDSISSSFIAANWQYRLSDTTMLVYDGVYDVNRDQVGTSNVSVAVERDPRLSYFVGWRYIHDTDNNLLAFGTNYRLSEKHIVGFREYYDAEEGRNYSTEIIYIRKWPRWYTAVSFDVDRALDDIGVNFSLWPEGAPTLGLGSKRYTGLTDSIGVSLR